MRWIVVPALAVALIALGHAQELSPTLPQDMDEHSFFFLSGAHHSGTTLTTLILCTHPRSSCIRNSGAPEDEGAHIQRGVYKTEHVLGGAMKYAYHPAGHLIETDSSLTDRNRRAVFDAWGRYWNLSRPVLVEKSPRHTIMTRYLQAMFTPDKSRFLVIMRHPLAASHYEWFRNRKYDEARGHCGRPWIEHWLAIYRWVREDIPHLREARVFQYERMLAGAPMLQDSRLLAKAWVNALYRFMGLEEDVVDIEYQKAARPDETMPLELHALHEMDDGASNNGARRRRLLGLNLTTERLDDDIWEPEVAVDPAPQLGGPARTGRKLLEFYGGNRLQVRVNDRLVYHWIPQWYDLIDMESEVCQGVIDDYERELNEYGYSLKVLNYAAPPPAFVDNHVQLRP